MNKKSREIVKHPVLSEKSMDAIEIENKLIFIVDNESTKKDIKKAVEDLYNVEVEKVNVLNTVRNQKKAFVKLTDDYDAMELATDLQLI